MRRAVVVALLMGFVLVAVCSPVLAISFSFTTIDVPFVGACCTQASAINDMGRIVGSYLDSNRVRHGFTDEDGEFTTVDVPGAIETSTNGINDRGEIVGSYTDGSGSHGFVNFKKKFRNIDFPAAVSTAANGINKRGQVVGSYFDSSTTHGFLRSGGKFSTIDVPGASFTAANAIDIGGQIVGANGPTGGFPFFSVFGFLDDDNVFTELSFTLSPFNVFTVANGINSGIIVGSFSIRLPFPPVGFVTSTSPPFFFETLSFPDSSETLANGINSEGQIVGSYFDSSGQHGFLAIRQ